MPLYNLLSALSSIFLPKTEYPSFFTLMPGTIENTRHLRGAWCFYERLVFEWEDAWNFQESILHATPTAFKNMRLRSCYKHVTPTAFLCAFSCNLLQPCHA